MRTVRARITALATVAVLVVLTLAGVAVVQQQRRVLTENLEDGLRAQLAEIGRQVDAGDVPARLVVTGDDDTVAQVVDGDGVVLAATIEPGSERPLAPSPPAGAGSVLRTLDGLAGDDDDARLLSQVVRSPDGDVTIHVAAPLDDVGESTDALVSALTLAVPGAALVLAGLTWWLVGRALRPVEAIRAEVAGIGGRELDHRVPVPAGGDEVARLARTMNAMLDRVEGAARRQERFVADASHELRSPLTRMRTELEVDLAHPATAEPVATHRSVLQEAEALSALVEDLLHLARSDAGAGPRATEPVDLGALVAREAARAGPVVDANGVGEATVLGDGPGLTRVVGNVLDNAVTHARQHVEVRLVVVDGTAVLTVQDDGPGIPAEAHERVFERFGRVDEARSAAGGGTGLGLAIARDVVERHGGTISVDLGSTSGARLVVRLPVAPEAGPAREPASGTSRAGSSR